MIRPKLDTDTAALLELATACGLFEPEDINILSDMLESPDDNDQWFVDEINGVPQGVAFLAPEKMTDRTWNLFWIAIHPDHQRTGRGAAILKHVQRWLVETGQRLLLVETAGVDEFSYVRSFYASHGFESEARIRDFYEAGVDKIVFRKSLTDKI